MSVLPLSLANLKALDDGKAAAAFDLKQHRRGSSRGWVPTDVGRPRCERCGQILPEAQDAMEHGA